MFWNVENLFDTKDDPRKNDNEFLPEATRHWNSFRYRDKLKNLAKGIIASGNEYVPDLVGLCEVENDSCLYDLTRRSPLREADYRYIITDSPDQRGIDVAFIDANHAYASTCGYFNVLADMTHEKSVIVVDDIHYSEEMERAWKEICADERVTSTIDLYQMGLVFFDKHYWKRNYKMRL